MRLALLFMFMIVSSPTLAGDEVTAAREIIRAQEQAFARDDATTAYSFAAPGIHERFSNAEMFLNMVQQGYAPVYRHKSFEFGEAHSADGRIAQRVHIVDTEDVPWEALYTLEQQDDGSLKISGCVLIKVGERV